MRNKKISWIVGGLIIAGLIIFAIFYSSRLFEVKEETKITSETVESSLKEAKELTTLKYHYKNVASYENSQQFYGYTIPFTKKRFIYTYQGDIRAGVDLDQVKASVNNQTKTITLNLPETKVLSHEIDEDSIMFFDEKESVFNQLKLEDYSTFRAEEKAKVEAEAIEKGLLEEAKEVTKEAVLEILKINPIIASEFTININ